MVGIVKTQMNHDEVQEHATQPTHLPIKATLLQNNAKVKHAKDMTPICLLATLLNTATAAMLNEHRERVVRASGKW